MSSHPQGNHHLSNRALLWRLLQLARPHLGWMLLGALLTLITTLASIGLLAISGWFLASMAVAGLAGVTFNYFTPAGVIRFLAIVRTAGRYGERLVTHNATLKLLSELRLWCYQRLEPLAPARLQGLHSGDLLNRLQNDIDRLDSLYLRIAVPVLVAALGVPGLLWLISRYDPQLVPVLLAGLLSVGVLIPLWGQRQSKQYSQTLLRQSAALRSAQLDTLSGMRELLIYGADQRQQQHCQQLSDSLLACQSERDRISAVTQAVSLIAINLTVLAGLWWLIPQIASGARPPVELAMLTLLLLAGFELVQPLPLALELLPETLAAARRLFRLTDQPPVRPEPGIPATVPVRSDLQIRDLSFSYPATRNRPASLPVLQNLNLQLNQGDCLALIGPSGAGKSTLTQLLCGFWPIESGQMLLGSTDINQLAGDELRRQIAVVSQRPYLFSTTLEENLRMARPDASREQLDRACQQAGLLAFVQSLPDGYQTWLGEQGQGLSGGQARRLAIARALLQEAPLLILDEPTEGLDRQTEQALIKNLQPLLASRTTLLISHRPALLQLADQICILRDGKVVRQGQHQTLVQHSTYYQNLLTVFH